MAAGGQSDKTQDARSTTRKTKKVRKVEYGPFGDYTFVATPTGEFAVPHGQVLSFGAVRVIDKATGQLVKKLVPEYRKATDKEMAKANTEYSEMMAALDEEEEDE
jgi:hypothetical protein